MKTFHVYGLAIFLAAFLGPRALPGQEAPAFPGLPNMPALPGGPSEPASGTAQSVVSHLDLDNYKLAPGDSVTILVYQEDDMTTHGHITKDGTVTIPLINQIKISGFTTKEAGDRIRDELVKRQFYVSPRVTVVLDAASQKSFIILGQISKPGTYAFSSQESINLVQAIALAGGLTRIANPHDVTVVRREGGAQQNFHVDAKKMTLHSEVAPFEIKSGDVITIGETFF